MANHHVRIGKGPHNVIALHGWFGSAAGWGPFAEVLDETRFSYAFMDYRGYGGSKDLPGKYSMEEISADALALADRLGWEKFSLLGHSMGGQGGAAGAGRRAGAGAQAGRGDAGARVRRAFR